MPKDLITSSAIVTYLRSKDSHVIGFLGPDRMMDLIDPNRIMTNLNKVDNEVVSNISRDDDL